MSVAFFTHPATFLHETGPEHPECTDRLRYILRALETQEFATLLRESCPEAPREALERAHTKDYIASIFALPQDRSSFVDADTVFSPGSLEAALRAAGGAMAAVDAVMEGWARAAFVAMRPPGHHAESNRAMGFCLFNNAAIAAHHARARWGLQRIAVADFDVHHGNGTQEIFWQDPDLYFASSHQMPCYPGSGAAHETGSSHNVINEPLAPGSGPEEFRAAWAGRLLPGIAAFKPELLIISAGFDAHIADPLAQLRLREADFAWITQELQALADEHCQSRLVSLLEGGYDLNALASCAAVHVRELMRL